MGGKRRGRKKGIYLCIDFRRQNVQSCLLKPLVIQEQACLGFEILHRTKLHHAGAPGLHALETSTQ